MLISQPSEFVKFVGRVHSFTTVVTSCVHVSIAFSILDMGSIEEQLTVKEVAE